jgi:hypothetical protein
MEESLNVPACIHSFNRMLNVYVKLKRVTRVLLTLCPRGSQEQRGYINLNYTILVLTVLNTLLTTLST